MEVGKTYKLVIPHWSGYPIGTKIKIQKINEYGISSGFIKFKNRKKRILFANQMITGYPTKNAKLKGWLCGAIPAAILAICLRHLGFGKSPIIPILKKYYFQKQFEVLYKQQAIGNGVYCEQMGQKFSK